METTHFDKEKKTENNHDLSVDRTVFAFERTALAYMRTGSTFLIASLTLIKLFDEPIINCVGYLFIPAVIYMYFLGIQKFRELSTFNSQK